MINMINSLKFKNLLVILFVSISLVVWVYKRESRKALLNFLFPSENIHVMIKGKSSQRILTLSKDTDKQDVFKQEELNFLVFFPFNGQIILEK